jgi:hypothetical protein
MQHPRYKTAELCSKRVEQRFPDFCADLFECEYSGLEQSQIEIMATESNEAAYLPPPSVKDLGEGDGDVEHVEKDIKTVVAAVTDRPVHEMYLEAMERYPNDEAIDQAAEKRLLRKLDMRILPLLGICYFFYVSPFNM